MKRHYRHSVGKNVFQLLYSTVISSGILAIVLILLANYVSAEIYAMVSIAIALSMILSFFTDMGMSNGFLREGSKHDASLSELVISYIKWRTVCLILTLFITGMVIHFVYSDSKQLSTILYLLTYPMIIGLTMQSIGITYFQLQERMQRVGIIRMINSGLLISVMSFGIIGGVNYTTLAFLFGLTYLLSGIISLLMVAREIKFNWKKRPTINLLTNVGPFFLSGLLILLVPQIGPLLLEKTVSLRDVGIFAISYRIPSALYQVPGVIAGAFFPILFRHFHNHQLSLHLQLHTLQIKWMGYIGMMICIPIIHLSTFLVELLFGSEWLIAAKYLTYIAPVLFLQSISIALADGLTTKDLQKRRMLIQLAVTLFAIIGYYFASLSFGLTGAIGITLSIEALSILGFWLMNPSRTELMKNVLLRHFFIFTGTLCIILLFVKHSPFVATISHIFLITVFMFLDEQIRNQVIPYVRLIKEKWFLYKVKVRN